MLEVSVDWFPTACLLLVSSLLAAMMVEAGTGAAVDRGPNGFEISALEMSKQCCHQHLLGNAFHVGGIDMSHRGHPRTLWCP